MQLVASVAWGCCHIAISQSFLSHRLVRLLPHGHRMRASASLRLLSQQLDGSLSRVAVESQAHISELFNASKPRRPQQQLHYSHKSVGRFRYGSLQRPGDFAALSRTAQIRAGAIVRRMLAFEGSESPERDLLTQVKLIDRLSDTLCGVIDLAELVRNVDPDQQWVQHADTAYNELCYFMNELNTHVGLYNVRCERFSVSKRVLMKARFRTGP